MPLAADIKTEWATGPSIVTRFNNYPAAKITGGPAPGVSSGEALEIMEQIANETSSQSYGFQWGEAREENLRQHFQHRFHLWYHFCLHDPGG